MILQQKPGRKRPGFLKRWNNDWVKYQESRNAYEEKK